MNYKLIIKKNILYLFYALFCVGLMLPFGTNAAEIFFVSYNQKPAVGELFKADFFLNTQEENINAISGKVVFSPDLLELKEVRDGNSIVNLWVERPTLKDDRQIVFYGITPGGYHGEKGLLFSLILRVLKSGPVSLKVAEGQALLNDGKGSVAKLSTPIFTLQIGEGSNGEQVNYDIIDKTPPESFAPEIARDENIEGGKWFVVFATQDKESGIDHYEAQENRSSKPENNWQIAVSPYVLQDQTLQSYIYIKAVDKDGNSVVAVINPKSQIIKFSYANLLIYGILLIVIFFGILSQKMWRKKRG